MNRAYYSSSLSDFLAKDDSSIYGDIAGNDQFATDDLQKNSWKSEITILKRELSSLKMGGYYLNILFPE